jgi:alanine transaminase
MAACAKTSHKFLGVAGLNPHLLKAEYAVRGAVPDRAEEIKRKIAQNPNGHGFPFNRLIACNIGNPQALGQQPLQFNREVISLISNPSLLENKNIEDLFKGDAVRRARHYLTRMGTGIGAYTNSQGFDVVREEIAAFIEQRDGYPSDPNKIFVTDGASAGVRLLYTAMIRPGMKDGVLVPIPQYPLYSALSTLFDGSMVGYYLDETNKWGVTVADLQASLDKAKSEGVNPRAMVVISPGNPTGQCLDVEVMRDIIAFCIKEKLVLMADEVYQENVYAEGKKFTSFKKVALDMGKEAEALEMVSFHSASKGFLGECGIRGGYFELHNIDKDVQAQIYKLASVTLCSNTVGQISIGLMVNPPRPGDESYSSYVAQRDGILSSLKRRAQKLVIGLNALQGVSCQQSEGAMYLFPSITLPAGAEDEAAKANMMPDTFYCIELLESTGIVTVPGSGFKQKDGTYHFRTTFLPAEEDMDEVIKRLTKFHGEFMAKYSGKKARL